MLSLEILTKAADLVETQDKQKMQSHDPETVSMEMKKLSSNRTIGSNPPDRYEANGNVENSTNGSVDNNRRHDHATQNGSAREEPKEMLGAESTGAVKSHDRKGHRDETLQSAKENNAGSLATVELVNPALYPVYQQPLAEQANGIKVQSQGEKWRRTEENPAARHSSEGHLIARRRSTSPTAVQSGETLPATEPMVLLQHPSATTISSIGSTHPATLANPGLQQVPKMHHPYLYSFMYPPGAAALDPTLSSALGRVPGSVLKDGEGQASPQNGSPNANLAAASAGLHFPTGLMYPFAANQALLMGARPPGAVAADISPMLLPTAAASYPVLDQYKRLLEGMQQFPATYSLQPQLADQYMQSLVGHGGLDGNNDALALSAMAAAGRLPPAISLAALQNQPGAAESWLRYPEQLTAAMGMLRPQDGLSPRSSSPYAGKRRTGSPAAANGGKVAVSSYPFHGGLGQPPMNSLSEARGHAVRSPAAALFSQNHRPRSPAAEARKPEVERSGYRSHSRDLDREPKATTKDMLASTSTASNHMRTGNEHLVARPYSVTDPQTGRKIPIPSPYHEHSGHVPPGYSLGLPARQPAAQARSPSPRGRLSDDRSHSRPSRDKSPADMHAKRRSLDSQYAARNSPILHDRHGSRPTSPTANGVPVVRSQFPLDNGSAEAAAAAVEASKANPYLMLASDHVRSSNANVYGGERREPKSGSPTANPPYFAGMQPYYPPPILSSLAGASPFMLPQYAQALAAQAKGMDVASLYKSGENAAEFARVAGWPLSFLSQQQQLLAVGRPPVIPQEYAAALKAQHPAYFSSQPGAKDGSDAATLANGRNKMPGFAQQLHPSLLAQHPPQAPSPDKAGHRTKYSPSSHLAKQGHHSRTGETHSPSGVGSGALSAGSARHYQSPHMDRPMARELSPKPSNKPYRPNPMLRQHAEDLERSRKRKKEEMAMAEDGVPFASDKHHLPLRTDQRDARKDPKRRKQLISEADPEDHFRRSLGKDYESTAADKVHISGSVDDHFKKALGPMYQNYQAAAPKAEGRDAPVHAPHALPSYSAAVASVTQSPRPHPPPHRPEGKESAPPTRLYDPEYLAKERYYITNLPPHHRKAEQSPPRAGPPTAPTVLYPPNPPIGPVRQKVKAKAYIPEAATAVPSDLANNRAVRASSLGSRGSSRSVSGSSAESLPVVTAVAKSPTPPITPVSAPETVQRPVVSRAVASAPYTFAHQQSAASTAVVSPVMPAESAVVQRSRVSPPPPRSAASEESPIQRPNSSSREQKEQSPNAERKPST